MKKSIKCGITAAVVAVAGFAAYQSYGSYGVQDNSLLMQNIEALAQEGDNQDGPEYSNAHTKNDCWAEHGSWNSLLVPTAQGVVICTKANELTILGQTYKQSGAKKGDTFPWANYTCQTNHVEDCCLPSQQGIWIGARHY